jgi:hypothetical protein
MLADGERRAWEGVDGSGLGLPQGNAAAEKESASGGRPAVRHSGRKSSYSASSLAMIKTAVDTKFTVRRPAEVLGTKQWADSGANGKAHTPHTTAQFGAGQVPADADDQALRSSN